MNKQVYQRCGFDRRLIGNRRFLFNAMPMGYCKRKNKIERRAPVERRAGWVRSSLWNSEEVKTNADHVFMAAEKVPLTILMPLR